MSEEIVPMVASEGTVQLLVVELDKLAGFIEVILLMNFWHPGIPPSERIYSVISATIGRQSVRRMSVRRTSSKKSVY